MGDIGVQGGDINGDKQDIGGKGGGEGVEDGEEMVLIIWKLPGSTMSCQHPIIVLDKFFKATAI